MKTTQKTIIKNRTMSMTAIKDAQIMDCASFYKKHKKNLEWDEVENLSDFNDGMVNLIYHGIDQDIAILFWDGEYSNWSYCS